MIANRLCIWNDRKQKPSFYLMTEEKNRDYKTLPTAEQDAKSLASFITNCTRGDSMDILLRRIIASIQYDHPGYGKDELNDDLSRAYSVISRISEEE